MSMPITLGWEAPKQTVVLDGDSDFFTELDPETPFADGTEIYLEWKFPSSDPVRWDAVITGGVARIYRTKAVVQAMIAARPISSKLHYKFPGGADLTWYRGDEPRDRT